MFVAKRFLSHIVKEYGQHSVLTEMVALGIHLKRVNF